MTTLRDIVDHEVAKAVFWNRLRVGFMIVTLPIWLPLWLVGLLVEKFGEAMQEGDG